MSVRLEGVRRMILCNRCKTEQTCEYVWAGEAESCVGFNPIKTNSDMVRSMTDEELAKFITDDWCEIVCGDEKDYCYGNCEKQILKWLRQEVTEDA